MRVLTFNLHSTYLYLLSFTGWDIESLVVHPWDSPRFHSQPYGYPTHSAACHRVPGYEYGRWHPKDWREPPPVPIVPLVPNITNVEKATGDYDLVIYLERNSIFFYRGPAGKKAMTNFCGDDYVYPDADIITVSHVPGKPQVYIPMGIPDQFIARREMLKPTALFSFSSVTFRTHMVNVELLAALEELMPLYTHDIVEEEWSYTRVREELASHRLYLSAAVVPGGPTLATIEALMAAMPVVLNDQHGHFEGFNEKEVLRVDLVGDPRRLRRDLRAVLLPLDDDRLRVVGEAGRKKALAVFDIDRFVSGWKELAGDTGQHPELRPKLHPKVAVVCPSYGSHCGIGEYAGVLAERLGVPVVRKAEQLPSTAAVVFLQYEPSLYSLEELASELEILRSSAVVVDAHFANQEELGAAVKALNGKGVVVTKVSTQGYGMLGHIAYPAVPGDVPPMEEVRLGSFGFMLPNKRYEEFIALCQRMQVPGLILASIADASPGIEKVSRGYLDLITEKAEAQGVEVVSDFLPRDEVVRRLRGCSHLISAKKDLGHTSGALRLMALAGRPIISVSCLGADEVGVTVVDSLQQVGMALLSKQLPLPAVRDCLEDYWMLVEQLVD